MTIDENIFFRESTLKICGTLNTEHALTRLMAYIQSFIPVTVMELGLYDPVLNLLRTDAWVSMEPGIRRPEPVISTPDGIRKKLEPDWSRKSSPLILNDPEKGNPVFKDVMSLLGWDHNVSVLFLRLKLEGEIIGSFRMYTRGINRYTDEHARLIMQLHDPLAIALSNMLKLQEVTRLKEMLADDNRYLHERLLNISGDKIIGAKSGLKEVMEMVYQVARMDSPVLLLGETGSGKEVIANALHQASHRKNAPFIKVNCGAIPDTLIDSELFGHEKGAFTGAAKQKRGLFERAHRGSIFLDEIGELPPPVQVRLLRVIQTREIQRVGGTTPIAADARIISATHRNLEEMVRNGRFREDLWFRLNVFPIMLPPLRQRKKDIPDLVHYFIERKCLELKIHDRPMPEPYALRRLADYHWPGNIRELENVVERALIRGQGQTERSFLSFENFNTPYKDDKLAAPLRQKEGILTFEEANRVHIKNALKASGGRVEGQDGAARILKLHPSTLRAKMRKLGIVSRYGKKKSKNTTAPSTSRTN